MNKSLESYTLDDLKRIYVLLHSQLADNPELMDSDLLHDLQKLLQQKARTAGVDISVHALWGAWLQAGG